MPDNYNIYNNDFSNPNRYSSERDISVDEYSNQYEKQDEVSNIKSNPKTYKFRSSVKILDKVKRITALNRRYKIIKFRRMFGITRMDLANLLGRIYRTVSKWEAGERVCGTDYIVMLEVLSKGKLGVFYAVDEKLLLPIRQQQEIFARWNLMKKMVNKRGRKMFPKICKLGL